MNEDEIPKPTRYAPQINGAPKIKQIFWCEFPDDVHAPEFNKTRPVIILSKRVTLHGTAVVIPCTTADQADNKFSVKLTTNLDPKREAWAVCDKVTTVAVSRLRHHGHAKTTITQDEFDSILETIAKIIPLVPIEKP